MTYATDRPSARTKARLAEFRISPDGGVLLHPQRAEFGYSDGQEVEHRILQALKNTADLSVGSPELLAKIEDWPTEYHFTDIRANLLRHLPLGPGLKVLELGAGCGAITRFLGEAGCAVTAVEGSLARASCVRERTRDLDNVSVYCANFQDVAFDRDFDVVTLVGVLEYAPRFFAGDDPFAACLAVARSALAPGGTLVVAIENQLGLKYFAGATEDHLGTHFSGIEGRYDPQGVRTLGRRQLEAVLAHAGFADVAFQYPFPDYKLPQAIVFEQALGRSDFRPSEIVRHLYARDYAGKDLRAIDASQVWPVLEANDLLGDLSNSFLVLARQQASGARAMGQQDREVLAVAYSTGRARRFQTRTAFRLEAGCGISCEKTLVYPWATAQPGPGRLQHRLVSEAYIAGSTLHSDITAALRSGDRVRVLGLLRRWLDFLESHARTEAATKWQRELPGDFWDCTPGNLMASDGILRYFDAEWISDPRPTIGQLVLRYVFGLAFGAGTRPQFESCFQAPGGQAVRVAVEDLGMTVDEQMLEDFAADCNEVNAVVFPLKPRTVLYPAHFMPGVHASPATPREVVRNALRGAFKALTRQ